MDGGESAASKKVLLRACRELVLLLRGKGGVRLTLLLPADERCRYDEGPAALRLRPSIAVYSSTHAPPGVVMVPEGAVPAAGKTERRRVAATNGEARSTAGALMV